MSLSCLDAAYWVNSISTSRCGSSSISISISSSSSSSNCSSSGNSNSSGSSIVIFIGNSSSTDSSRIRRDDGITDEDVMSEEGHMSISKTTNAKNGCH
jgi:hypothetical protein